MVKKILLIVVLLPFLILALSPKKELVFLLENRLAEQGIVIADGMVSETLFSVTIEHPVLYYKGVKVATAGSISLWSALLYTQGTINDVIFDASLTAYLPAKLEQISLVHTVAKPINVAIVLTDKALPGEGDVNLKDRSLHLQFSKMPRESSWARYLKKTKGGWTYEQRF
jgi:hypothetical protein